MIAISDWPIQGLTIDLLRRELYNGREGDWDFFSNKKTMICNLEPRVISAQLKMSRNDPGLEIEKKNQFQEDNKSNIYKCFIDQVKDQFGRILTQWRIRDPQKKLTRKLFFLGSNPSMTILYSGFLCFLALPN